MHVVFISNCVKRSKKRTRRLLDSYAIRISDNVWTTPIQHETLKTIHKGLRSLASKNTSVSCFINDGRKSLKLLWTVGSSNMKLLNGQYPTKTKTLLNKRQLNHIIRIMCLIAKVSGYGHDLGKSTVHFQDKLKQNSFEIDPIRHEWTSMKLMQLLRNGYSWQECWDKLKEKSVLTNLPKIMGRKHEIDNPIDSIDMCVLTHHGFISIDNNSEELTHDRFIRDQDKIISPAGNVNKQILDIIKNGERRLNALLHGEAFDTVTWYQITLLCRAMLIMADHTISSDKKHISKDASLYANTYGKHLNQDLNWHLSNVGDTGALYLRNLLTTNIDGLCETTIERILKPSSDGRFVHQDEATAALRNEQSGMLIFNIGSTGSGKTLGNAKIAAALAMNNPDGLRFTVALNLRTLTLQTGDSFRKNLRLSKEELCVLIGDHTVQQLHETQIEDEDGNEIDDDIDVDTNERYEIPTWLQQYCNLHKKGEQFLGSPVFVSTIDYLNNAGVPYKQKHHPLALLRIATSDLILDEIDTYDPKARVAVCRIVELAAMFGRNVICSSATLDSPTAELVYIAYQRGIKFRSKITKTTDTRVALVSNYLPTKIQTCVDVAYFQSMYSSFLVSNMMQIDQKHRIAKLINIDEEDEVEDWQSTIFNEALNFHSNHKWNFNENQFISFGVIRIANIRVAVPLARRLCELCKLNNINAHILCYHANDIVINRYLKEKKLDFLLSRKISDDHIRNDSEIKRRVSNYKNTLFIVVATPVEEIGRDHDFDWGIIEPSSLYSIVQIGGRINRHREKEIVSPNIGILQFNYKEVDGNNVVFERPGYEKTIVFNTTTHPNHDCSEIISWNKDRQVHVDVRLYKESLFGKYDNTSIKHTLNLGRKKFFNSEIVRKEIWSKEPYNKYILRERTNNEENWRIRTSTSGVFHQYEINRRKGEWVSKEQMPFGNEVLRHQNDWGAHSFEEMVKESKQILKHNYLKGLEFKLPLYGQENIEDYTYDCSFGFYR